jgi:four helix bundle protein
MNDQPSPAPAAPVLDPHRLDVYAVALEFSAASRNLVPRHGYADARSQLARASLSIVLNIAEACGRVAIRDRSRFFAIARGSAFECAAVIDVLERHGEELAHYRRARALLARLVQMLTRLVRA